MMRHACAALVFASAGAYACVAFGEGSTLYVRGQALSYVDGYFVFTTGDAIRLRRGTVLPKGLSVGSVVTITLDRASREVTSIALDPPPNGSEEIDIGALPRQYVVISEKSAPRPKPSGLGLGTAAAASGLVNVTIDVNVPANTPVSDDVYLSTDRSTYSPAEVRMQRLDARRFSISLGLPANTLLKYQFTRGTYQSVERDRTGGIEPPHELPVLPNAKAEDTVARWADIS
jgi:hypothetical protein